MKARTGEGSHRAFNGNLAGRMRIARRVADLRADHSTQIKQEPSEVLTRIHRRDKVKLVKSLRPLMAEIGSITNDYSAVKGLDECTSNYSFVNEVRPATLDDATAIAELFKAVYGLSTHPCSDPEQVTALLSTSNAKMVLAERQGQIIGCVAATRMPVPGVFSPCYLAVHKNFRRLGYSKKIYVEVVRSALAQQDCDVLLQLPRSIATYRLVKTTMNAPVHFVGHDGGMNVAHGVREYHSIAFSINPGKVISRAIPERSLALVERRMSEIRTVLPTKARPDAWCVDSIDNPPVPGVTPSCLQLEAPDSSCSLLEAFHCIDYQLDQHRNVGHHFVVVPVDKRGFLHGLYQRGFRATAWLPAWYPEFGIRHDCALMVRRRADEPKAYGLERLITFWDAQLSSVGRQP